MHEFCNISMLPCFPDISHIVGPSVVAQLMKEVGEKARRLEEKFKTMITGSKVCNMCLSNVAWSQ